MNRIRRFVRRHLRARQAEQKRSDRPQQDRPPQPPVEVQRTPPPPPAREFELPLPRRDGDLDAEPAALAFSAPRGLWVPRKLENRGLAGFEPETVACFLAALDYARPGAVLDVGANVGLYGLLAAARCHRAVYSFEPTPRVAAAARKLAAANDLPVEVVELAMSDRSGEAALSISSMSDASNSLAEGFRPSTDRIQVEVDTLSGWCERTGTSPAVIKIDTETTEPDVIAGGHDVLRESRPWVFCEVLPGHGAEKRLMESLRPLGYTWYQLNGELPAPAPATIDGPGADHHQRMWLFAPERPTDAMWKRADEWSRALRDCAPVPAETSHEPA
ncbi:FkbM family methyltransferase [Streptomonospora litoralis]|uniref:2-O-methyltransferase NoeI n=1 Tax=Streptomonospora litoralis TaxID=2498135 RepID=A0A4P6Q917_9ACTN|nr:FkbM family methyltransferase [Streptomonospora litoralis]QBI55789.1 2-O-methyltransferase NoeI [Streptomonospora litoralis]